MSERLNNLSVNIKCKFVISHGDIHNLNSLSQPKFKVQRLHITVPRGCGLSSHLWQNNLFCIGLVTGVSNR